MNCTALNKLAVPFVVRGLQYSPVVGRMDGAASAARNQAQISILCQRGGDGVVCVSHKMEALVRAGVKPVVGESGEEMPDMH